jgi:hypothetical protein
MLDIVMEAPADAASSPGRDGKSLGEVLHLTVEEAFAIMRKDAASSDAGLGESVPGMGTSTPDKIYKAARSYVHPGDAEPSSAFRRAVFWHWANLEYGCSADLNLVRRTLSSCACMASASSTGAALAAQ